MSKRRKPVKPTTIKGIRAAGYSKDYEARLIRAVRKARKSGKKFTRQSARGHKKKEHVERKEKELKKYGITSSQRETVKAFLRRFNEPGYKGVPVYDDIIQYIKDNGYSATKEYIRTWDRLRKEYVTGMAAGTLIRKGKHYVIGYGESEVENMAGLRSPADISWLYYH